MQVNSVITINGTAFAACDSVTKATIPTWAISAIPKTSLSTIVINGGMSIDYDAFNGCTTLSSITIPDDMTSIGSRAFSGCTSLTSITIPDSVTSIGAGAFHNCTSLTSIAIPNKLARIESNLFSGCTGLTSITIPSSVISVGTHAFYDCTNLDAVHITDIDAFCSIFYEGDYSYPLDYAVKLYVNGVLYGAVH